MNIFALDLETRPLHDSVRGSGGLEPWRQRQGLACISSIAVSGPDGFFQQIVNNGDCYNTEFHDRLKSLLEFLADKVVYAHNAVFDVAWLIATLQPSKTGVVPSCIKRIKWRDSMLLAKWVINGQKAESMQFKFNLKNLVQTFLKENEPGTLTIPEFVALKDEQVESGENDEYWIKRGKADTIYTRALAIFLSKRLPEDQRRGVIVEASNIVPVANSWLIGIRIDKAKLDILQPRLRVTKKRLAERIGVDLSVISSPKQLGILLFDKWKLPVHSRSAKTNAPSTGKDSLMWIEYQLNAAGKREESAKMKDILQLKSFSTIESKYVKTMYEALSHTNDGFIYGSPKIFGTYTGRFTYSNSTLGKFKTGIALHQMPRKAKYIRELLLPPEGYKLLELDASGQESRLMAIRSQDPTMLSIFQQDLNFHAMTGAALIGMPYHDFMDKLKTDKQTYEYRQRGKLLNLAANYRIGAKSFSEQAFVKYEEFIDINTSQFMLAVFKKQYPGVPIYWDKVIQLSKDMGYTEEFGGRRYKLQEWREHSWVTESAALMFPIQGAGASMKNIAITEMAERHDDTHFLLDLHDANFSIAPEDVAESRFHDLNKCLNDIDYGRYWAQPSPIPLPYEGGFGDNFGDVK